MTKKWKKKKKRINLYARHVKYTTGYDTPKFIDTQTELRIKFQREFDV